MLVQVCQFRQRGVADWQVPCNQQLASACRVQSAGPVAACRACFFLSFWVADWQVLCNQQLAGDYRVFGWNGILRGF